MENACRLIDEGHDVFGIGTGDLIDFIQPEQIARIYALWTRAKSPFERNESVQGRAKDVIRAGRIIP